MNVDGITTTRPAQPATFGELARLFVSRPPSGPEAAPAQGASGGAAHGLQDAIKRANDAAASNSVSLRFGIHQASGEFYVRVLDSQSGETIKTIPPESLLDFRGAFERSLGILFDGTA